MHLPFRQLLIICLLVGFHDSRLKQFRQHLTSITLSRSATPSIARTNPSSNTFQLFTLIQVRFHIADILDCWGMTKNMILFYNLTSRHNVLITGINKPSIATLA